MRCGPRVFVAFLVLSAVMCSPALAADTLNVYVDSNSISLGSGTQIAAHAETDAAWGGGHVAFKFKPADQDCRATPADDEGTDATGQQPTPIAAGAVVTDVAGEPVQLDVGNWRICGWLVDDSTGLVVAQASTVVQVIPYSGSISIAVARSATFFQITLTYATSAPGRLYASLQPAAKQCPRNPARMPKGSIPLVPRSGRFVGGDGGLGRAIKASRLSPGRWRVCSWLVADVGRVGPASRTFAVRARRRRAVRVAG